MSGSNFCISNQTGSSFTSTSGACDKTKPPLSNSAGNLLYGTASDNNCYQSSVTSLPTLRSNKSLRYGLPDQFDYIFSALVLNLKLMVVTHKIKTVSLYGFNTMSECLQFLTTNSTTLKKILEPYEIILLELETKTILKIIHLMPIKHS